VTTFKGRSIAFPNHYQHCVSVSPSQPLQAQGRALTSPPFVQPFELADTSLPGHRSILVFWLVHPDKPVTSTANVPPQQVQPLGRALLRTLCLPASIFLSQVKWPLWYTRQVDWIADSDEAWGNLLGLADGSRWWRCNADVRSIIFSFCDGIGMSREAS
jgi:hypothetical protein